MERKKKVLIVSAVVLVMIAVGVIAYPFVYRWLFPLPTSVTLTLTPQRITMGDFVLMPVLSRSVTLELRDASITIQRQNDSSLLFTYAQDKQVNLTGCNWSWNSTNKPAKYTEVTFSSQQFTSDATLLMCDDLHLYFKSFMTVTVTVTETTIGV